MFSKVYIILPNNDNIIIVYIVFKSMGIKGLNSFLKKRCPEAFIELPLSHFKGKRIAIDSDNVLRRFMSRAHKEIVDKTDVAVVEPNRNSIISK